MSGGDGSDREGGGTGGGLTRRRLIGLGVAAAAAGGVAVLGAVHTAGPSAAVGKKLEVSARCLGCTGCVVVCPEAALFVGPGCRLVVEQERCTRCGYCVAVCPVDALRVIREAGNG